MIGLSIAVWKAQAIRARLSRLGPGWDRLHPEVKRRALLVIEAANKEFEPDGLKVGIFEGWRTEARQRQVMGSGNSFVSEWLRSYHPWGLAVDFVFITPRGRWSWLPNPEDPSDRFYKDPRWLRLGAIIEKHGFEWGGRWRSFDGPHAQLPVNNLRPPRLRAVYGEPLAYINTFANVA